MGWVIFWLFRSGALLLFLIKDVCVGEEIITKGSIIGEMLGVVVTRKGLLEIFRLKEYDGKQEVGTSGSTSCRISVVPCGWLL